MLTTAKLAMRRSAIALGIIVVNFSALPTKAQTYTSESFNFEEISVGENTEWNFTSEDETISVEDNIKNLEEFEISESDDSDVRLVEEKGKWGNRGARSDYLIKTTIYDY